MSEVRWFDVLVTYSAIVSVRADSEQEAISTAPGEVESHNLVIDKVEVLDEFYEED